MNLRYPPKRWISLWIKMKRARPQAAMLTIEVFCLKFGQNYQVTDRIIFLGPWLQLAVTIRPKRAIWMTSRRGHVSCEQIGIRVKSSSQPLVNPFNEPAARHSSSGLPNHLG